MIKNNLKHTFDITKLQELNQSLISSVLKEFDEKIIEYLKLNQKLTVEIKIQFNVGNNNLITNLTRKTIITYQNFELWKKIVMFYFKHCDLINRKQVNQILFLYSINTKDNIKEEEGSTDFRISGIRLPTTMELNKWGKHFYTNKNNIWIKKRNSNYIYKIVESELSNQINLIYSIKNKENLLLSFTDIRNEGDSLNTFTRTFSYPHNTIYFIYEGKKYKLSKVI